MACSFTRSHFNVAEQGKSPYRSAGPAQPSPARPICPGTEVIRFRPQGRSHYAVENTLHTPRARARARNMSKYSLGYMETYVCTQIPRLAAARDDSSTITPHPSLVPVAALHPKPSRKRLTLTLSLGMYVRTPAPAPSYLSYPAPRPASPFHASERVPVANRQSRRVPHRSANIATVASERGLDEKSPLAGSAAQAAQAGSITYRRPLTLQLCLPAPGASFSIIPLWKRRLRCLFCCACVHACVCRCA